MKTQLLMTTALGAFLAMSGQVDAGEKELSRHQVPKGVLEAFDKAYPNAKEVEFEKEMFEGKPAYEVEYKENGREYEAMYDANGILLQTEEEIEPEALPGSISQAVTNAHPKARIKEAEKLMSPDGTVTGYEVEIKQGGKELELELDTSGKILKTERE